MKKQITLDDNILVAGFIARQYSKGYSGTPVRWFGGREPDQTLLIGNDVYNIGMSSKTIDGQPVNGVAITIKFNDYGGGEKSQKSYFFSYEDLNRVQLVVQGYEFE